MPQVCRATEDADVPDALSINWQESALVQPDVKAELHVRFKLFFKKTRIGRTAGELSLQRKAKWERRKKRKKAKQTSYLDIASLGIQSFPALPTELICDAPVPNFVGIDYLSSALPQDRTLQDTNLRCLLPHILPLMLWRHPN